MNRDDLPGEEEQYEILRALVEQMDGHPVTARTLDIGGEKLAGPLRQHFATPANPALGEIARQRLAQVLGAQNKAEDALKLLDGDADKAFLATREELKGDLLVQLGRTDDAHAAYQKAKQALADDAAVGGLQMKLDDLAKGDA